MDDSQGQIPLRPDVHDSLDARLQTLLNELQCEDSHGDVSATARRILSDFTHEKGVPLQQGEKLLSSSWEQAWQAGTDDWLTSALFGDIDRNQLAHSLYVVFREMVRFVLDSQSPHDKKRNRTTLIEALRCYLSRRGYELPVAEPSPVVTLSARTSKVAALPEDSDVSALLNLFAKHYPAKTKVSIAREYYSTNGVSKAKKQIDSMLRKCRRYEHGH